MGTGFRQSVSSQYVSRPVLAQCQTPVSSQCQVPDVHEPMSQSLFIVPCTVLATMSHVEFAEKCHCH